jgi:hypothetical protein
MFFLKKHIIENMLYMSELNKKNVMVCKQIFNINNEYKMNIHEGDSLEIKIEEIPSNSVKPIMLENKIN